MRRAPAAVMGALAIALSCGSCADPYEHQLTAADDGRVIRAMVGDDLRVDLGDGWTFESIDASQFDVRSLGPDGRADIELRRIGEATLGADQDPPLEDHWEVTVVVAGDPIPIVS